MCRILPSPSRVDYQIEFDSPSQIGHKANFCRCDSVAAIIATMWAIAALTLAALTADLAGHVADMPACLRLGVVDPGLLADLQKIG
jgi:hypothetical protein